jgi:hypothetical protein
MASAYMESENSESCETESGSDSEVENGDLTRLESQKPGNLKDELEEEDRVGFVASHSTADILHYGSFVVLYFISSYGVYS